MRFVYFGLAWFVGIFAAAMLLAPPIIIIAFGIPFTYKMKREGVLTSTAPATRYMISFVILLTLFVALSWATWYYFPNYIWGYVIGVLITIVPSLGRCGRTETNVNEFFQTNAEHVDQEALSQYFAQHT